LFKSQLKITDNFVEKNKHCANDDMYLMLTWSILYESR